jgi:hypothetical protein
MRDEQQLSVGKLAQIQPLSPAAGLRQLKIDLRQLRDAFLQLRDYDGQGRG